MIHETKIIIVFCYIVVMILFYVFIIKRLSHINRKHIEHTSVPELNNIHKSLIIRISLVWLCAILVSSALILAL